MSTSQKGQEWAEACTPGAGRAGAMTPEQNVQTQKQLGGLQKHGKTHTNPTLTRTRRKYYCKER